MATSGCQRMDDWARCCSIAPTEAIIMHKTDVRRMGELGQYVEEKGCISFAAVANVADGRRRRRDVDATAKAFVLRSPSIAFMKRDRNFAFPLTDCALLKRSIEERQQQQQQQLSVAG